MPHILSPRRTCKYLQGTHCIKIGCKCVEKRWFKNDYCLIKELLPMIPPPPKRE